MHAVVPSLRAASTAGAVDYARIVSERAVTRNLIHVCTSIQSAAYEGSMPGHGLLDWAESQVFALGRGAADSETVGIQSVLNEAFDEIQALIDGGGAMSGLATGYLQLDEMTAGEFTTFVVALLMLYQPIKRLNGIYNIFQQALGAGRRVLEYVAHPHDVAEREGAVVLPPFARSIEFQDVSFHYPDAALLSGAGKPLGRGKGVEGVAS